MKSKIFGLFVVGLAATCGSAIANPVSMKVAPETLKTKSLVQKVHNCHANIRFNYVPEVGYQARHSHRGNSCTPVIIQGGAAAPSHCHANGQRHSHSGVGRTVHSHYGNRCRVDVWNQIQRPRSGGVCARIGPLTFCK